MKFFCPIHTKMNPTIWNGLTVAFFLNYYSTMCFHWYAWCTPEVLHFFFKNVMYQVLWISVQINKLQVYSPTMISFPYAFLHKLYSRHNVFLWLCCNEKLKYFRLCSSHYSWFYEILVMPRISANMHAVDIILSQLFKSTAMFDMRRSISQKIFLFYFFLLNNEFHDASWCLFILQKSFQWPMTHKLRQSKVYQNQFWCIWFYPFIQMLNTKTVA